MSLGEALSRVAAIEARAAALRSAVQELSGTQRGAGAAGQTFQAVLARATESQAVPNAATAAPTVEPQVGGLAGHEDDGSTPATGATEVESPADDELAPGRFAYPLGVRGEVIGLPYQGSHTLYGNWESENAVDIRVPKGTPVYAVADGVIGSQIGPLDSSDPHLQGQRLHLETEDNEFYYAHLSQIVVQPGQHVRKGQLLGYSGEANGVEHLHLAAKTGTPVSVLA